MPLPISEVPSAKSFFVYGYPTAGKTTLALTLPRPCLGIILNPPALESLQHSNKGLVVETFYRDNPDSNIASVKDQNKLPDAVKRAEQDSLPRRQPQSYKRLSNWLRKGMQDGSFKAYKSIFLDGLSDLNSMAMDLQLWNNARPGGIPGQDEYAGVLTLVGGTVAEFVGYCKSNGINIMLIAHIEDKQKINPATRQVEKEWTQLFLTGALRTYLIQNIGNKWHATKEPLQPAQVVAAQKAGLKPPLNRHYISLREMPNGPPCGTNFLCLKGEQKFDVTIDDWSKPLEYGISKLLRLESELETNQ